MQLLAGTAIALYIGVSIVVAVRLLLLHRRTGGSPEALLGGMLLLSVGIGYPLGIAIEAASPAWTGTLQAVSDTAISLGFVLLFVFTWRVFQPRTRWARALALGGAVALLGKPVTSWVVALGGGHTEIFELRGWEILLQGAPIFVAYVWTAWESLLYHDAMRKRVRLGLASAEVANRFLLWGLMGLVATCGVLLNLGALMLGFDIRNHAGILLASTVTGSAQTVILVLAFLPPRAYLSWVRKRATVAAG